MLRLAIGRPSWVRRISGSLPRFPTKITLFTLPAIAALHSAHRHQTTTPYPRHGHGRPCFQIRPTLYVHSIGKPKYRFLEHDPEKCEAVFRKDHAQTKN